MSQGKVRDQEDEENIKQKHNREGHGFSRPHGHKARCALAPEVLFCGADILRQFRSLPRALEPAPLLARKVINRHRVLEQ